MRQMKCKRRRSPALQSRCKTSLATWLHVWQEESQSLRSPPKTGTPKDALLKCSTIKRIPHPPSIFLDFGPWPKCGLRLGLVWAFFGLPPSVCWPQIGLKSASDRPQIGRKSASNRPRIGLRLGSIWAQARQNTVKIGKWVLQRKQDEAELGADLGPNSAQLRANLRPSCGQNRASFWAQTAHH